MATIYMTHQCCPCQGLTNPCCVPPAVACCMYPAAAYDSGIITFQDLPNEINFLDHGTITKNNSGIELDNGDVLIYGSEQDITTFERQPVVVARRIGGVLFWANYLDFAVETASCLFSENVGNWEDTFEDTYTAIVYDGVEFPVNRTSLCIWEGSTVIGINTFTAILYYGGGLGFINGGNLKWNLAVGISGGQDADSSGGIKADPQNNPVGTYTDPINLDVFYVNP